MKNILTFLSAFLLLTVGYAQTNNQMVSPSDSDPEAKLLLDKMRNKYQNYRSIQANFDLALAFPNQPVENQKIEILQSAEKYRLEMPGRTIISDGVSIWMILHRNKEVQINNAPEPGEDQGIMSPQSLFNIYESNEFVYALSNEMKEGNTFVQQIEFKPIDTFSDYSKLRLTLNKSDASFKRIKTFGKDGSQFTLTLNRISPNIKTAATDFVFNKSDYPDYYIEDLR